MSPQPPTEELADLAEALGLDNVRTLVRTFLHDFPKSLGGLSGGQRSSRYRHAHSMKSNARLMGMHALSRRMEELENRLTGETGAEVTPQDLRAIQAEFDAVVGRLREFVGE